MDLAIVKKFLGLADGLYVITDVGGYRIGSFKQQFKGRRCSSILIITYITIFCQVTQQKTLAPTE